MEEWKPKRSLEEVERIVRGPGSTYEVELAIIDERVLRVYKNLPPSLRIFWLNASAVFKDRTYIIFENERYTYGQTADQASRFASLLYTEYGVRKGDRVAIAMRNFPEFIVSVWAIQLVGAIGTYINAWLPANALQHCISITKPTVLIVDPERADRLSGHILSEIKSKVQLRKVLVVRPRDISGSAGADPHDKHWRWRWTGMASLTDELAAYSGPPDAWRASPDPLPDDDATIFFTSGTTGLPKGVLGTHRAFLSNYFTSSLTKIRSMLRNGESIPAPNQNEPQKAALLSTPLFHTTAGTSTLIGGTAGGAKIVLLRKWTIAEAVRLISEENITAAGGVPSMAMDLIESSADLSSLERISYGGAPASDTIAKEILKRFPKASPMQGYGLTETNALVASVDGFDYLKRPASTGIAAPICDIIIVGTENMKIMPPGKIGEVWVRGPNIMRGYWNDPVATDNAITKDGWFKSGDLGLLDEEGFLYIKDRAKDMIIRGGENIHSIEVENALYADERLMDAAAAGVPDRRLGELVTAVVTTKPAFHGQVTEESVIEVARRLLPAHAVPVMILVQDDMIERNANGKITKDTVRKQVQKEWDRRLKAVNTQKEGKRMSTKL